MIGIPVQFTLWRVYYKYTRHDALPDTPPSPPPIILPLVGFGAPVPAPAAAPPPREVTGQGFICTADASGADLLSVLERAVTGAGARGSGFQLMAAEKVAESVRGTALLEGGLS